MLNGYRAFPAAHKVLDLLQYLLSTSDAYEEQVMQLELKYLLGCERELTSYVVHCLQMEIWGVESVLPLIATLFLGVVILGTGVSMFFVFAFLLLRALVSPV